MTFCILGGKSLKSVKNNEERTIPPFWWMERIALRERTAKADGWQS